MPAGAEAVPVSVVRVGDNWGLERKGEPFFVNGAGLNTVWGAPGLPVLKRHGGNATRTWMIGNNTEAILDEAHRQDIAVAVGIWLGHPRHGFDYHDSSQLAAQKQHVRDAVLRFKDHPAVLMWGLGNEMEGFGDGDDPAVWDHLEDVAAMVKRLDPLHPTMTTIAEVGGQRVPYLHERCPSIDIVGINSYGGALSVAERYREAGGSKPYIMTEFGPLGSWEVGKTEWGAPIEQTSTEKAAFYRQSYQNAVAAEQDRLCLGGFAFFWGQKQEVTETWFNMFLKSGERLESVDAMQEIWTGRLPDNRTPRIERLGWADADTADPGGTLDAELVLTDPEGDPLEVVWVVRTETDQYRVGGDREADLPEHPEAIAHSGSNGARVQAPTRPGYYRLFVYARDNHDGAAVGNLPFRVRTGVGASGVPANPLLPFRVLKGGPTAYAPTGWMGRQDAIEMKAVSGGAFDPDVSWMRMTYTAPNGWGGVAWQYPENDWGDDPRANDLTGATRLVFTARGEEGGEQVKFGFGLIGSDKLHPDSARVEKTVTLTKQWKKYSIDLTDKDLSRIKTAFSWVVTGQGKPITFFLDDVCFE